MSASYYISQALVVIAYLLLGIGLKQKKQLQILTFSTIYQFIMIFSYLLLDGTMGIFASLIALVRNFVFIYNEKQNKKNSIITLILFSLIAIGLTIKFYKNFIDLFPLALTLIGIFSYWSSNTKITRIGNIIISLCYIIYSIPLKSWFTIVCEVYLIIQTLLGYFKNNYHSSSTN